jgi:4-aminobutyrate aminotransferase-like enzyme
VLLAHGYLKTLVPWLQSQGIVCICDEVQVGFGRLGQWFWGFEMQEVIPDIVVLGKPMANGFPIGAVVTTEAICSAFENGMEFFSSFGGNPISMEAARAILDVIEEEQLQNSAIETGNHFMTLLRELQSRYECIGDVRGEGLFIGVEFRDSNDNPGTELCKYVKNKLKENYILTGSDGRYEETLKMKPPLCFSKANADQVAHKMGHILSEYIQKI